MNRNVNYEPLSPLHFLERSAYIYPEKTAVIYGDQSYTYATFKDRVCRLATALKQRGIKKGDKVAFMCPNISQTLEAAVVGIPHEKWQEVPKVYIKLKEGSQLMADEVKAFCKERMAKFKVPKEVEFRDPPKTATGKIQKNKLRERK